MKKLVSVMGVLAALGLAGCGEKVPVAENGDTVVINFIINPDLNQKSLFVKINKKRD